MIAEIRDAILQRQRFVITSHARPDGDAIGSQLAMAFALRQLGKSVQLVDKDPAPPQFSELPRRAATSRSRPSCTGEFDAAIVMECGDLSRTGVDGFEQIFHHQHRSSSRQHGCTAPSTGSTKRAAACGEMVFDLIEALGVPLTPEIATHIYLTILTDTGGFHFSHITPQTFEICRRCTEAGAQPGGDCARDLRQQHDGPAEADGRRAAQSGVRGGRPRRPGQPEPRRCSHETGAPTKTPTA